MIICITFIILLFITPGLSMIIYNKKGNYLNIFLISLSIIYFFSLAIVIYGGNWQLLKWVFWSLFILIVAYWLFRIYRASYKNWKKSFTNFINHYIENKYLYIGLILPIIFFCFTNSASGDINFRIQIGKLFSGDLFSREKLNAAAYNTYRFEAIYWWAGSVIPNMDLVYTYTVLMQWIMYFIILFLLLTIFEHQKYNKKTYILINFICFIPLARLGAPESIVMGGIIILFTFFEIITKKQNYLKYSLAFFSPTVILLLFMVWFSSIIVRILKKIYVDFFSELLFISILSIIIIYVWVFVKWTQIITFSLIATLLLIYFIRNLFIKKSSYIINNDYMFLKALLIIFLIICCCVSPWIIFFIINGNTVNYLINSYKNSWIALLLFIFYVFLFIYTEKKIKKILFNNFLIYIFLLLSSTPFILINYYINNGTYYYWGTQRFLVSIYIFTMLLFPEQILFLIKKINIKKTYKKIFAISLGSLSIFLFPISYFLVNALTEYNFNYYFLKIPHKQYVKKKWVTYFEKNLTNNKYYSDFPLFLYSNNEYIQTGINKQEYNLYVPSRSQFFKYYRQEFMETSKLRKKSGQAPIKLLDQFTCYDISKLKYVLLDNVNPIVNDGTLKNKLMPSFVETYSDSYATIYKNNN